MLSEVNGIGGDDAPNSFASLFNPFPHPVALLPLKPEYQLILLSLKLDRLILYPIHFFSSFYWVIIIGLPLHRFNSDQVPKIITNPRLVSLEP